MSAIIVIEIIVGIVVLAAAVWFAVRDTRQRSAAAEPEVEPVEPAHVPARHSAPQPEQEAQPELTEVSSTETN